MQNDTNVDVSSKINLNTHSASTTSTIYFYIDVPFDIKADNYNQVNFKLFINIVVGVSNKKRCKSGFLKVDIYIWIQSLQCSCK
jgi:hypothetical protein